MAAVALLSACGGGGEGATAPPARVLTTIVVTVSATTIEVGQTATASVAGFDQNGASIDVGSVVWTSGSTSLATVSASGVVTGVATGQVVIFASTGGRTGQAPLTLIAAAVASVAISPVTTTVASGGTRQFTATAKDVADNVLTGRTITWSSSATTVAAVNGVTGLVTAVAVGTATISATSEGKTGTAVLTVIPDVLRCAGAPQLGCGLGLDQFSLIPPGTFQMGSALNAPIVGEGVIPEHAVTISRAFYMQKTEVTQGQWQAVMGSNPSYFSNCALSCPVEYVSYNDIRAFIERLTASTGFTYRLPTEAEWEYAARAGTTGDSYATLDSIAWYAGNAGGGTHPAAGKQANAWGLYDTIGNVSEWVSDWYGPYSPGAAIDPTGPAGGTRHVSRGASWSTLSWMTFGAMRYSSDPSSRVSQGGFRLARSP